MIIQPSATGDSPRPAGSEFPLEVSNLREAPSLLMTATSRTFAGKPGSGSVRAFPSTAAGRRASFRLVTTTFRGLLELRPLLLGLASR